MEPTKDQLPSDVSLDFAMTEQNIWGVWCARDEVLRMIGGTDTLYFNWYLADSFEQIVERSKAKVLAGISLLDMKKTVESLEETSPSWWPFSSVSFVERRGEKLWAESKQKDDKLLFKGKISGLKKLTEEGYSILNEKDYMRIFFDIRPVSEGHPSDWLSFMRNPVNAMNFRQIVQEYGLQHLIDKKT